MSQSEEILNKGRNIWNTDTQGLMFLICKVLLINEVAGQEKEIPMTNKHTKNGQPYSEMRK